MFVKSSNKDLASSVASSVFGMPRSVNASNKAFLGTSNPSFNCGINISSSNLVLQNGVFKISKIP